MNYLYGEKNCENFFRKIRCSTFNISPNIVCFIFNRYLQNRGHSKRHTLALSNPMREIPEELQRKLSLQQPLRSGAGRRGSHFQERQVPGISKLIRHTNRHFQVAFLRFCKRNVFYYLT